MKKFLLLMLVLGLATGAQAGLVFTVDGEPQPNTVILMPSEIIELDLETTVDGTITAYELDYVLTNAQAEFIWDGATNPRPDIQDPMTDIEFPAPFDAAGKVVNPEPQLVKITASQIFNPALEGEHILMKELYIHCLEDTDVILQIINVATQIDGVFLEPGAVLHTLYIDQYIPEPMTIALLGLGGLFALRKRK